MLSGVQIEVQGKGNPTMEDLEISRDRKTDVNLFLKGSVIIRVKVVEIKTTTNKNFVIVVTYSGKEFEISCYNEDTKRGHLKLNKK